MTIDICGRGGRLHLLVLHMFDAALNWEDCSKLETSDEFLAIRLRYDPSLNVALSLAVSFGLLEAPTAETYYKITEKGKSYASELLANSIMKNESEFLRRIGKKASLSSARASLKAGSTW